MPFKLTETQHGIWRHQKWVPEGELTDADAQAFAGSMDVAHRLDAIEENAKRILRKAGLPDFLDSVEITASGWRRLETSLEEAMQKPPFHLTEVLSMTAGEPRSQEYLAAKCLYYSALVRALLDKSDTARAVRATMQLMDTDFMGFSRSQWEPEILANRGSAKGRQKGQATLQASHEERRRLHEAWRQRAEQVRDRNPTLTDSAIAQKISRETGEEPETIRKRIRRKT